MATIGELAATVAQAEGLDQTTVALIARYLREEGFIQKKGRGPSAARMAVADAVNLLIAVNASITAVNANKVVPVYRELAAFKFDDKGRRIFNVHEPVRYLKLNGTFGEALELLIGAAITGKLPDPFLSASVHRAVLDAFEQGNAEISIEFEKPDPKARIRVKVPAPEATIMPSFVLEFWAMSNRTDQRKKRTGDRKDHTEIGHLTIFSVAKVLQPRSGRKDSITTSKR
jgi:hypothetical protein